MKTKPGISTDKEEEEAHYFAMCLIMPEYLLRPRVHEGLSLANDHDEKRIKVLAQEFAVTREMMTARLIDLKLLA